jgi:hypothetical protein
MAAEKSTDTQGCPDGGTCHHECAASSCFRVKYAGPLSAADYPNNEWPEAILKENGVAVEEDPSEEIRERMAPERLIESSEKSRELAGAYLKVLREEVPSDYHFGSVASIHTLKDALVALAEQASAPEPLITDDRVAEIIEYAAFLDELDHPQVLTDAIALLIRTIHSLKPDLEHSDDWLAEEDDALRLNAETRWLGEGDAR